ncbi:MAG: ABC transporter permease [Devosia sp.]|nr:ABC transporter permease [Devosia sp.]
MAIAAAPARIRFNRLGVLIAGLTLVGLALPFAAFRANRIVPGAGRAILEALPLQPALLLLASLLAMAAIALVRSPLPLRLLASLAALSLLLVAMGRAATYLTPAGDALARISPAAGFWVLLFVLAVLAADALAQMKLKPAYRIGVLALVLAVLAAILLSDGLSDLSVFKEYANRADAFWREAETHVLLAFGSLLAALVVGIPLGIACIRLPGLRASTLNVLNVIQTIPSIALFGLLIPPLAWIAFAVPGASGLGISGIGMTPALVALFGYSLLPVVANTVIGIEAVPAAVGDAALGMGMTARQRLFAVELPLAFPIILTGIRIVLVQNIGLATIAALIGGGGFGVFVFQGIGQTAMDLVLLGAVPTVLLAFASALVLDALVEMARKPTAEAAA